MEVSLSAPESATTATGAVSLEPETDSPAVSLSPEANSFILFTASVKAVMSGFSKIVPTTIPPNPNTTAAAMAKERNSNTGVVQPRGRDKLPGRSLMGLMMTSVMTTMVQA